MNRFLFFGAVTLTALFFTTPALQAGAADPKAVLDPKELGVKSADQDSDWSVELASGALFSNVRESNLDGYTIIPINATAALKIDDVSLDNFHGGYLRGNTEFLFQGYYDQVVHGPAGESHIEGGNFGPRYNFVQPGWKVVPYVQGLVGFGFADSNPTVVGGQAHGLGQDFNFTFGVGGGARYDISDHWFTRLGIEYTHFSNAGLSEPAHPNRAIDGLGPQLGVGYRF